MTREQKLIVKDYRSWRESARLPWDDAFVPKSGYSDIRELEALYWLAEDEARSGANAASKPASPRRHVVSKNELEQSQRDLVQVVADYIGKDVLPRLDSLESKQIEFGGTWKPNVAFAERCLVSHQGGLWLSKMPNNTQRPGNGSPAWRLAVKRGVTEITK